MSLELNGANVVQAEVVNEGKHLHVPDAVIRKQFYTAGDHQIDPESHELCSWAQGLWQLLSVIGFTLCFWIGHALS